ncbi:MAG: cohesin domain-containing protein [Candidatus Bathyarchaeia archaeon]
MRNGKASLLALIILALFVGIYPLGKATPGTVVAVDPTASTVKLGQTFGININITDVTGLLGFDFQLSYDATVLKLVDIQQGSFLKSVGSTLVINLTTNGVIWLAVAVYSPQPLSSANGSGVLATATFKAVAAGESLLDLYSKDPYTPDEVKLVSDPPPDSVAAIPNVAADGHVFVSSDPADPPDPPPNPPPPTTPALTAHALAPKTVVGQGYKLPISVTTANQGDLTETFSVASYANTAEIGEQTLTLSNGSSTTVSFVWNTNGFAYGNYSVTAQAFVPGQTSTASDTVVDAFVIVTIPGDLSGDFKVNISDAILLSSAFNSKPGSSHWNPNADINGDGVVNILDSIILANHFLEHYP